MSICPNCVHSYINSDAFSEYNSEGCYPSELSSENASEFISELDGQTYYIIAMYPFKLFSDKTSEFMGDTEHIRA